VPDEKRTIKSEWIKFRNPYHLRQKHLNVYTSADFAWTEMKRSDFRFFNDTATTEIYTIAVDERWNYIFLDQYRKRCNKVEAIEELFRQWDTHKTDTVVLQKYDQRGVKEMIEQYAFEHHKAMYVQWITYPPNLGKVARFETLLQPNFAAYKIYLMEGMQWFIDEELMDLPRPKFDDGMDCLSNIIRYAKPAHRTHVDDEISAQKRRIMLLKKGVDPWAPKEDFIHY
jgi:phage terminase large subunit-like protein